MSSLSPASSSGASSTSSPHVLTPRRKIQALLAELSSSDDEAALRPKHVQTFVQSYISDDGQDSSEEDQRPIGRLAARLKGASRKSKTGTTTRQSPSQASNAARSMQSTELINQNDRTELGEEREAKSTHRRFLIKKKQPSIPIVFSEDESQNQSIADSPLSARSNQSTSTKRKLDALSSPRPSGEEVTVTKSRFHALVEKQKQLRLQKEEMERAKQQARLAQASETSLNLKEGRVSSPVDDTDEDSDASAAEATRRLAKDARPTRKASKKALEEMNRETQRMHRNMQLAHQAKTKKKFSKEVFLSSFVKTHVRLAELTTTSTTLLQPNAGSISSSDNEQQRLASTPLTSPSRSLNEKEQKGADTLNASLRGADILDPEFDDLPSLEQILAVRRAEQTKLTDERQLKTSAFNQSKFSLLGRDSGSDSDLDIINEKGLKRKYAAFENLAKKKGQEKPSHLALRSLANMNAGKLGKGPLSSVDMAVHLRRAAREQAKLEREEKIEKLKARGIIVQTAEEKERDQQELEDLVEKARLEAVEIQKREKHRAKKDGTFTKDALDEFDESDEDDGEFEDGEDEEVSGSEDEHHHSAEEEEGDDDATNEVSEIRQLVDAFGAEPESGSEAVADVDGLTRTDEQSAQQPNYSNDDTILAAESSRIVRKPRVIIEDDEEEDNEQDPVTLPTPKLSTANETPQTIRQAVRKLIPGLQNSDDLPLDLTQAFAATLAESQSQTDETSKDTSLAVLHGLSTPRVPALGFARQGSVDHVAESPTTSQAQPLGLNLGFSQLQVEPASPSLTRQPTGTQAPFELTQDGGYNFSPFTGDRFAETPNKSARLTATPLLLEETAHSPNLSRRGRLQRGHVVREEDELDVDQETAFSIMRKAEKQRTVEEFNKKKSEARKAFDEAAEESDDEYAGLGGVSDEDSDEEANEQDRAMIDEDTQIGKDDEARLAQLYADKERQSDEAAVSKLLKDITTGALRRKRGVGDDLDLSDEEDAAMRRREAKRREFAKMRKELLKDEAIGKIAEDKKKEAFLRSIEDREIVEEDDGNLDRPETQEEESQSQPAQPASARPEARESQALQPMSDSRVNKSNPIQRAVEALVSKPTTLAQIREQVSFLIEEPDSQAATIDLGLSDSEDDQEAYVNLDRHFRDAERDENALEDDGDDLGEFVVDDDNDDENSNDEKDSQEDSLFKKPGLPSSKTRAPFSERRTRPNIVDRLALTRLSSSSSTSTANPSSKPAFFTTRASSLTSGPSLLRRATTNSSLGSFSSRHDISATGVMTAKAGTERGSARDEKEFIRKGKGGVRNAVNYQASARKSLAEEKMSKRAGVQKRKQAKASGNGFLGGLFRGESWE